MASTDINTIIDALKTFGSSGKFEYETSLDGETCRTIRVIELLPLLQGDNPTVLKVNLIHLSLDESPEYDAISYCWGGQTPSFPIICDGKMKLITENLATFLLLLRLRLQDRVRLFVDAICINQESNSEKNAQVPLMQDIYSMASMVHIWLGNSGAGKPHELHPTFDFLRWAAEALFDSRYANLQAPMDVFTTDARRAMSALGGPNPPRIAALLSLPWFSRVWVIQEAALCRRGTVYYGPLTMDWHTMCRALVAIISDSTYSLVGLQNSNGLDLVGEKETASFGFLATCTGAWVSENRSLEALIRHRQAQATDPRDKVYGLWGLLTEASGATPRPDYNLSVREVYTNVASAFIRYSGNLDVLSVPRKFDSTLSLPSWVPDWTGGPSSYLFDQLLEDDASDFEASGRLEYSESADRGDLLHVHAIAIDQIAECGMPMSQMCEGFEKAKSLIIRCLLLAASLTYLNQNWRRVAMADKASGKLYPNGEDRLRVFLHLIYEDDARPDPDTKRLLPRHLAQRATEIWAFGLRLFLLHHFPFVYNTLVGARLGRLVAWSIRQPESSLSGDANGISVAIASLNPRFCRPLAPQNKLGNTFITVVNIADIRRAASQPPVAYSVTGQVWLRQGKGGLVDDCIIEETKLRRKEEVLSEREDLFNYTNSASPKCLNGPPTGRPSDARIKSQLLRIADSVDMLRKPEEGEAAISKICGSTSWEMGSWHNLTLNTGVETHEGGIQSGGAEDSGIKCIGRKYYQACSLTSLVSFVCVPVDSNLLMMKPFSKGLAHLLPTLASPRFGLCNEDSQLGTPEYTTALPRVEESAAAGCTWCNLILVGVNTKLDPRPSPEVEMRIEFVSFGFGDEKYTTPGKNRALVLINGRPLQPTVFTTNDSIVGEIVTARELDNKVNSTQASKQIHSWLAECDHHETCGPIEPSLLPTTMIEVSSEEHPEFPRLFATKGTVDYYVALSYCWGLDQTGLTKISNLESRLQRLDVITLSRTIQDTITTTRKIGMKYVWIDAVCIIQDSMDDKEIELASMCRIYQHATVTTVAASASSANQGFLEDRGPPNPSTQVPFWDPNGKLSSVSLRFQDYYNDEREPINTRAWTLQEQLLSPRLLIYATHTLQYHCQQHTVNLGNSINVTAGFIPRRLRRFSELASDDLSVQAIGREWGDIIAMYSQRYLSYPEDKLTALAGVAESFSFQANIKYLAVLDNATLPFGRVRSGHLKLMAYVRQGFFDAPRSFKWSPSASCSENTTSNSSMSAMLDNALSDEKNAICLAIARRTYERTRGDSIEPVVDGLIISPLGGQGTYRRVGCFSGLKEKEFKGFDRETVTLV
ncbi:hypothetical protein G7Y89_g7382 [Cudoniella acicularis]|uniref:Heterokaryon incompatibility domain-containing protein n=1 Tax=Cudoniella acicularis TaxID=354080 RepID=A0A8H4W3V4_9HELO|nr:hypothetical protein G7Y89_g7382 [Cudoniella acicularis]